MNNLKRTIDDGIKLEEVLSKPDFPHDVLLKYYKDVKRIFVWGSIPSNQNRRIWEKMKQGDYFFILVGEELRYIAKILYKVESKSLGKFFWGETKSGETWSLIYFLSAPIRIIVPEEKIREISKGVASFGPRGLSRFSDERIENIVKIFGSVDNFVCKIINLVLPELPLILEKPPVKITPKEIPEQIIREYSHDEIKKILVELGKLLDRFPEEEEPINGQIDVVWKKSPDAVPYIAFEIHIKGNLQADLIKLQDAYNKWNCIPVLVTTRKGEKEARRLLTRFAFRGIKDVVRIIQIEDILEMHKVAKKLKELHKKIGEILFKRIS